MQPVPNVVFKPFRLDADVRSTTMHRRLHSLLLPLLVVALAMTAGWYFTNSAQQRIELGSGFNSCWQRTGNADQIACLSDRFEAGAKQAVAGRSGDDRNASLLAYVRTAEESAASDTRLAGSCHPAMHKLGRKEGRRAADAGTPPAFPTGSSQLCTAGYVHGLAEGYLTGTPDAEVATVFPALCHVTKAREGCAHGVGHALLRARADEPAVSAAAGATRRCQDLPGDFPTNCLNGVYMELAMRTRPSPVSPSEYTQSCATEDVEQSLSCWGYLTMNLTTNDIPIEQAQTWCARADQPGQFPCIEQNGRALGVEGVDQCATVSDPKELRERCVDGAVGLQVGSGHVSKTDARQSCTSISGDSLRRYCTNAVNRYAKGRKLVEGA